MSLIETVLIYIFTCIGLVWFFLWLLGLTLKHHLKSMKKTIGQIEELEDI